MLRKGEKKKRKKKDFSGTKNSLSMNMSVVVWEDLGGKTTVLQLVPHDFAFNVFVQHQKY